MVGLRATGSIREKTFMRLFRFENLGLSAQSSSFDPPRALKLRSLPCVSRCCCTSSYLYRLFQAFFRIQAVQVNRNPFFFFFQRKETMAAMLDALKSYVRTPSTQNQAEDTVLLHVTHSNLKQHFIEIRFDLHVSNFCKYTSVSSKLSVSRTRNQFLSLHFCFLL